MSRRRASIRWRAGRLWDLLFRLAGAGTTLFVTTHYMDEAERCSRVGWHLSGEIARPRETQDLKRLPEIAPDGSQWLEITSDDATRLLPELRRQPDVVDATIFGEAVHALVRHGTAAAALEDYFANQGDASVRCRAVPPSLEDVFVTLTRIHRGPVKGR